MVEYEKTIFLWDDLVPWSRPEDAGKKAHLLGEGTGVEFVTDVVKPTITYYPCTRLAKVSQSLERPAVVVCPGGGYKYLAVNLSGRDICGMLNRNGFDAFLLQYRCPDNRAGAYADAARAMRWIRFHAEEFCVDPQRLGVIGFSAGGHLAAMLSAGAEENPYPAQDAADCLSFRPDFAALIYPAYLVDETLAPNPEFKVTAKVPPTFLAQAEDDGAASCENSIGWFMALKRAGVPVELHVWPTGGHGYGVVRCGNGTDAWDELAGTWFRKVASLS